MTHRISFTFDSASQPLRNAFARHVGLIVPVCIIGAVLVVVAPLPTVLMDLLLAANITLSVVMLLTTTQVANPLQFSVFPSLLLGTTLARLVLNIATTRLILTRAADLGTNAAGGVIEAFGDFVTSGSAAVGLILFLILVAIQFLVITQGTTRISEVAARFALDGMPGRQMAIDADLAAGAITPQQAQSQRQRVAQQADFYGAMDGASKFVRGDAVAGLVITSVNILGGLTIGVVQHGMSLTEAAGVFTTLTIGDGLVSQLPAFLIAVAAGLLVTRTSIDSNLSQDAVGQTFAYPVVLYAAAGMLAVLAFTGLPMIPLLCLAAGCGVIGFTLETPDRRGDGHDSSATTSDAAPLTSAEVAKSQAEAPLFVPGETQPLALELGLGLLSLARSHNEDNLVRSLGTLRERLAQELGYVIPKLRIRDNLMIGFREFRVTLDGVTIANGTAADPMAAGSDILAKVESAIRTHSHELLSRQQVHQLLDLMRKTSPRLVDEVVPDLLKAGQVHQVLTSLLREQVSIRNLESILSTLADAAHETRDVEELTEAVRETLGRTICRQYCRPDGTLPAITLDPMFEASLAEGFDGRQMDALTDELAVVLRRATSSGRRTVLVCRSDLRTTLRIAVERQQLPIAVLSRQEITPETPMDVITEIGQALLRTMPEMVAA